MHYAKIRENTAIKNNILSLIKNDSEWVQRNSFDVLLIPQNYIVEDNILSCIANEFETYSAILKMNPNTFYNFHRDEKRKCAINLLLTGFDSSCFFADKLTDDYMLVNFEEFKYQPDTFYLLDTKKYHAVANKNNIRYLLSMGIYDADFDTVLKYFTTKFTNGT